MSSKFSWILKKLGPPLILCVGGALLLTLPNYPGELSNTIAWLESNGRYFSFTAGSFFIALGIFFLFATFRKSKQPLQIVHGKLTCLIEQKVIQSLVEQILAEFFDDETLHAEVSLKQGILHLNVEIPENISNLEDFKQYLVDRLFVLVGYYGEIVLSSPLASTASTASITTATTKASFAALPFALP